MLQRTEKIEKKKNIFCSINSKFSSLYTRIEEIAKGIVTIVPLLGKISLELYDI